MRLIDADELMEHVWRDKLDSRELIAAMIEKAPTINMTESRDWWREQCKEFYEDCKMLADKLALAELFPYRKDNAKMTDIEQAMYDATEKKIAKLQEEVEYYKYIAKRWQEIAECYTLIIKKTEYIENTDYEREDNTK